MRRELAVLISGGLDSAILLGEELKRETRVHPLFLKFGLGWEEVEQEYLRRYLHALAGPKLAPLKVLEQPVRDIYGEHWSVTGRGIPDAKAPDEDVFLPGRNVLLLAKPLIWCHLNGIPALALGSLGTNPFPDATPSFFEGLQNVVNQGLGGNYVEVVLPLGGMKKVEVMRLGRNLPLEHTFSCIQPVRGVHCGQCNKCAERQRAFADSNLNDPTQYARSTLT